MTSLHLNRRNTVARFLVTVPVVLAQGCGSLDFLELEDYQRDLLIAGLLAAMITHDSATNDDGGGSPGQSLAESGWDCWDLNANGVDDLDEDVNGDGVLDVNDCRGSRGPAGASATAGLDCWDLNGNGLGDPNEDVNGDGMVGVDDCNGPAGPPGPDGAIGRPGRRGSPGEDGQSLFHLMIDDFFTGAEPGRVELKAAARNVQDAPPGAGLSTPSHDAIGFRAVIPASYDAGNDVLMRLHLYWSGPPDADFVTFTLDARRLRNGKVMEPYDHQTPASPGECQAAPNTPGCGRRWMTVNVQGPSRSRSAEGLNDNGKLVILDLPVNTSPGLGYPNDLAAADFLAFELGTLDPDNAVYELLAVELLELRPGTAALSGATVLSSRDERNADVGSREKVRPG